jgi:hypothetical protein
MTDVGMIDGQTTFMDRYELARTVHADKIRAIEAETHRRLLMTKTDTTATREPIPDRSSQAPQRSTSSPATTR